MIVTVFRSRLNPEHQAEYTEWAARMAALARTMPGYVSHKGFTADDGERVTVVEFDSLDATQAWGRHPEHLQAMKRGREAFYLQYSLQVCEVRKHHHFDTTRPAADTPPR
ncbi:antibiotic biosynthesis monooxygenase [Aquabacterium lacunae]|uniref:Antibiotic biosynthesis monooxygenase n=1 Tax=Aquabacterium lacunae TaxID=2528630 RepID=A0A4Q9H047_9BURK|nr:antibiotic biosynthesis monooxygenase [Aquabacterium lacunae]TBO32643.1 antibiotic biosynthesis monooxygenase [Aquabacterium lacunae]